MADLTEDEKKIIEAMARAICDADGFAPDNDIPGQPNWLTYIVDARRQYAAHKAMMEAWRSAGFCLRCGGKIVHMDGGHYGQSYATCVNCGARA